GALVTLSLAEGVTPRFYENSPRQFVLDIDIAGIGLPSFTAASLVAAQEETAEVAASGPETALVDNLFPESAAQPIKPFVSVLGSTVRVVFPFEQDTPAAVFRRGDTVWLMFDTVSGILPPTQSTELDALASDFA